MMIYIKTLIFSIIMSICSGLCCSAQKVDNTPISTPFELEKYLGSWYEIARYDHSFERGLSHCKAQYSLKDNGKVEVRNTGLKNGKDKLALGKAKRTQTPTVLRVSFFGPFYSDYRILLLADDYSYALIGSKAAKYLWILSRTPKLAEDIRTKILAEATKRGYDVAKLIWVEQD